MKTEMMFEDKRFSIPNVFELTEEEFNEVIDNIHPLIVKPHQSPAKLITTGMALTAFSTRILLEGENVTKEDAKNTLRQITEQMVKCIDDF